MSQSIACYDIFVLGGGPAGYTAALTVAQLSPQCSVGLAEKPAGSGGGLGGTCLNRGCIPTKTYLENAETIKKIMEAGKRGISVGSPTVDLPAAVKFKDRVVKRLSMGVAALLRDAKVTVYYGIATVVEALTDRFIDDSSTENGFRITVDDGAGNVQTIVCKKLILATGAQPASVPIPGLDLINVLNSDQILDLKTIPPRLVIIGGGVIGVEMARVFQAYGTKVTIVEMLDRLVANMDPDISIAIEKTTKSDKINLELGVRVTKIESTDNDSAEPDTSAGSPDTPTGSMDTSTGSLDTPSGSLVVHYQSNQTGEQKSIETDLVLVSIGRKPCTQAFENLGLEQKGPFIAVDDYGRTSNPNAYAVGDLTGRSMLAHSAIVMGKIAARHAVKSLCQEDIVVPSLSEALDPERIPAVIYGEPSAAGIGLTQPQLASQYPDAGDRLRIVRASFGGNGRAVAAGSAEGFVKILVLDNRIRGIHLFGPMASELINTAVLAQASGNDLNALASMIFAHPTFGETIHAALEACRE